MPELVPREAIVEAELGQAPLFFDLFPVVQILPLRPHIYGAPISVRDVGLFFALFISLIFIFLLYSFFNRAYGLLDVSYGGVSACRPKPWLVTKSALMM